jgi:hypothetical protein
MVFLDCPWISVTIFVIGCINRKSEQLRAGLFELSQMLTTIRQSSKPGLLTNPISVGRHTEKELGRHSR